MNPYLVWTVLALFAASTLALATYGLHLYVLVFLFRRRRRHHRAVQQQTIAQFEHTPRDRWPMVTSQIPLYNERNVARRVMEAVAAMDYPRDRHEVQILDDSDDA
ncbi:MAG: glycosyl transferase family 2, partial [Planctomycetes bacterium]|nr:glycosyl transferase family 2 [Planctomycetota bacterium]